ncbi:MAG: methyltransferase domain-containing protein [Thermodesulfovibrionales bacterium]|nr:methyltransferase domain-containing protein [Thermodesulfovibrionales bacterium]
MLPSASHRRTNDKAFELISSCLTNTVKILDLGAGKGHLARRVGEKLIELGLDPRQHLIATDLFEDCFQATEIPFEKADFNKELPFLSSSFDIIYSIEVVEHMRNPFEFINECHRLLKHGGKLIISTPNTIHLTSRIEYLLTGFHELFMPLSTMPENAGRLCEHIMPLHVAYYDYALRLAGFSEMKIVCDKEKNLSKFIYFTCYPFIRLASYIFNRRIKQYDGSVYNENRRALGLMQSRIMLTARSLMFIAEKPFA